VADVAPERPGYVSCCPMGQCYTGIRRVSQSGSLLCGSWGRPETRLAVEASTLTRASPREKRSRVREEKVRARTAWRKRRRPWGGCCGAYPPSAEAEGDNVRLRSSATEFPRLWLCDRELLTRGRGLWPTFVAEAEWAAISSDAHLEKFITSISLPGVQGTSSDDRSEWLSSSPTCVDTNSLVSYLASKSLPLSLSLSLPPSLPLLQGEPRTTARADALFAPCGDGADDMSGVSARGPAALRDPVLRLVPWLRLRLRLLCVHV
jgi:hypothetical protein